MEQQDEIFRQGLYGGELRVRPTEYAPPPGRGKQEVRGTRPALSFEVPGRAALLGSAEVQSLIERLQAWLDAEPRARLDSLRTEIDHGIRELDRGEQTDGETAFRHVLGQIECKE